MAKRKTIEEVYPDTVVDIRVNLQKLYDRLRENPETGCWEPFKGGLHRQGYAMVGGFRLHDQKKIMTTGHRVILKHKLQSDLKGLEAIHSCNNMRCCNPDHLFAGTHLDNMSQMHTKGRMPKQRYSREQGRPQPNRKYRYSIEQLVYIKYHTAAEIIERYPELNLTPQRANKLRQACRGGEYKWLPQYEHLYK